MISHLILRKVGIIEVVGWLHWKLFFDEFRLAHRC